MKAIKRDSYINQLKRSRGNGLIKIITGLRRSGKSFLLKRLWTQYLLSDGVGEDHIIIVDMESRRNNELRDPVYYAEQAVLLYRVKDLDEAIKSCRKAIELDSTFPDAHRLLGICLRDKGNTSEARTELQRAVDLGDTLAQGVLNQLQ